MRVEILRIEDCPNWREAEAAVRDAGDRVGVQDLDVVVRVIRTADEAALTGFGGSPTILVNGRDPFRSGEPVSDLACRIYWTDRGAAGSPTVDQLAAAFEAEAGAAAAPARSAMD
jgi:hypothetical protein